MTNEEIKKELQKIYKERNSWNRAKGPFTDETINHRKLTVIKQYTLYKIQKARRENDKKKEDFNLEVCKIINKYL